MKINIVLAVNVVFLLLLAACIASLNYLALSVWLVGYISLCTLHWFTKTSITALVLEVYDLNKQLENK